MDQSRRTDGWMIASLGRWMSSSLSTWPNEWNMDGGTDGLMDRALEYE